MNQPICHQMLVLEMQSPSASAPQFDVEPAADHFARAQRPLASSVK
jgi:hypothetical protein